VNALLKSIIPAFVLERRRRYRAEKRAADLNRRASAGPDLDQIWDTLLEYPEFTPFQKRDEILGFCKQVQAAAITTVLEIGTANAGTTFMLTRVVAEDARILTLDFQISAAFQRVVRRLARCHQEVIALNGDSHSPDTVRRVGQALEGREVDLLFIDGDHSLEGVSTDFELYRGLVRQNGLIAFHDIAPDSYLRFGVRGKHVSGGVPLLWEELRQRYPYRREFIASPDQMGFGIGVVDWRGAAEPSPSAC
jgi:predicted O-methyltransferase YrrM